MELANIEKLLEKYLNAETSIAEEKELKTYFLSNNVAPHLVEYQALFGYFSTSKNERYTKTIQLNSKKRNWKWLSLAASVILVVSVYTGYENIQQRKAEKVYAQTIGALEILSANLNKGNVAITQLQYFDNTTNKIFKQPKK
jgi:anti-sigma-K factor RskA